MKSTGELRKELADCLKLAKKGVLHGEALKGVIGCANQINASLNAETKARIQFKREGLDYGNYGSMRID